METQNKKPTIKDQLILLLGRKVIMLIFCIIIGAVLYIIWNVDIWYIVGLYGAFVGGNGVERISNRLNNNRGE